MTARDLALGLVFGIIVGALLGTVFSSFLKPVGSEESAGACPVGNLSEQTLEVVSKKLSNLLGDPRLEVKILDSEPVGELYRIDVEILRGNKSLKQLDLYLTADASLLFSRPLNLTSVSTEAERVNVSEDDDPWRGAEKAKVVIVEFSDYACPYCARLERETIPKLLEEYGDVVKVVFRDFPVHGNVSILAAIAADCAGEQGKYWEFHDVLFEKQQEWYYNYELAREKMLEYAASLGLDVGAFETCIDSGKYSEEVKKDQEDGISYGVRGTPTIFVNGLRIVGYISYEELAKIVEEELG
ncbi:MAG: DsbA family protein [Archaeoglobaceae archaeon]